MASRIFLGLVLLMVGLSVQAQVYKWVDANGKVTYSDTPPPKNVTNVETRSFSSSEESGVALPFELAKAVKSAPVTMYISTPCPICDEARNFLKQNGIPYSEKTVTTNADIEKLNKLSGGNQLPFLLIGKIKLIGYNFPTWRSSLSLAGYPDSNILPSDYQYPAPQPAAPVVTAPKNNNPGQTPGQDEQPARDPNGFQF
ncbi:glutaredoxin [Oxalobacteraceae bacterium GrIS 2.11]